MRSGCLILWNATAIFDMSKNSWQMEKNSSWTAIRRTIQRSNYSFWAMVEYYPISARDQSRLQYFRRKVLPGIPWMCVSRGRNLERQFSVADIGELEKVDASEIYLRRINAKERFRPRKGDNFILPAADGTATLSGRDYKFRESTPRQEQPAESENLSGEFQGEPGGFQSTESRDAAECRKDFWSVQGDFIHRRHTEPRVQLNVPKELKYIDVTRSTHKSGRVARKSYRWLLEGGREQKFVRILDRIREVHIVGRKPSKRGEKCGPGWDWHKFKQLPDLRMCGLKYGSRLEKPLRRERERKTRMGNRETKTRQRSKVERHLLNWSRWWRIESNHQKFADKNSNFRWRRLCFAKRDKVKKEAHGASLRILKGVGVSPTRFQKRSVHVSWKRMDLRDNVWNLPCRKITKTTLQAKDILRWPITN